MYCKGPAAFQSATSGGPDPRCQPSAGLQSSRVDILDFRKRKLSRTAAQPLLRGSGAIGIGRRGGRVVVVISTRP